MSAQKFASPISFFHSHFYQLLNRTVTLFQLIIWNSPESIITRHLMTKVQIEYHFLVIGGFSVLVIKVKHLLKITLTISIPLHKSLSNTMVHLFSLAQCFDSI